jgi:hypothetical protein
MDLFEVLGLLGVLALWAALGCVPWFVGLVATHARRVNARCRRRDRWLGPAARPRSD